MQVLVLAPSAKPKTAGPRLNLVPKTGGNVFKGSVFYQDAGTWSTGNNLDGSCPTCTTPPASQFVGRERLWRRPPSARQAVFFANIRKYQTISPVPGAFANLYAGDATKWTYAKESGRGHEGRRFQEYLFAPAHKPADTAKPRLVFPRVPVPVFGVGR